MHEIIKQIFTTFSKHYQQVGDYSVTGLIAPPRIVALKNRYPECEKDISMLQSTASLIGTGVHKYVENLLTPYSDLYSLEQTHTMEVLGKTISGTYDLLVDQKHLFDIKTCKTWKKIFDPDMKEWVEQQNIYKYLLKQNGINVESLNIIAVYLDWQEGMLVRNKKYPREPIQVIPLTCWSEERTEQFIMDRVIKHKMCEQLDDDSLPPCTPEERWERFPEGVTEKYAVMKAPNAKRAMKLFISKKEATEYCRTSKNLTSESYIEVRYAQRTRCDRYCKQNVKCNHYQTYINDLKNDTLFDTVPIDFVLQHRWI